MRYLDASFTASARELGSEVDEVVLSDTLKLEGCRPRGKTLGRRRLLSGYVGRRYRTLLHRPNWLARLSVEDIGPALFRRLHQGLDRSSVDGDLHEIGGGGSVVVPDVVLDQLLVPDSLPRLHIERHNARTI